MIAGITLEGTKVAALEAKRAVKAGAEAGLVYPSHGWLRFGYQKGSAARSLPRNLPGKRFAADPVSVSRCDKSACTTSRPNSKLRHSRACSP